MTYGLDLSDTGLGEGQAMLIRRNSQGGIHLNPVLDGKEPPLSWGRISASDTVELAGGKRRLYGAVVWAFSWNFGLVRVFCRVLCLVHFVVGVWPG
jgi:hypothetical protein